MKKPKILPRISLWIYIVGGVLLNLIAILRADSRGGKLWIPIAIVWVYAGLYLNGFSIMTILTNLPSLQRPKFCSPSARPKFWNAMSLLAFFLIEGVLIVLTITTYGNNEYWPMATGMWTLLGFMFPLFVFQFTKRSSIPVSQKHALVLSKRVAREISSRGGRVQSISVPYLTFRLEDGTQLEFRGTLTLFKTIEVGETGTLVYKVGKKTTYFVDFVSDRIPR